MLDTVATPPTGNINARIATSVRVRRAALGLSLAALADRSHVSRSMLSLVERGESSATAVVLEKIASGLGLPLARLFDAPDAPASPVSRPVDRTTWRDPQSGYRRRNLSPSGFPSPLRLVEVELPAGARVKYETGARDAGIYQQIWVLEGAVEVTVGRATHRLETDDCLAMRLNERTAFHNPTRRRARYLVTIASETPAGAAR